jgi:2-[(L-alanin-3-ylcarbamoyl)methyl]-2-hydroxybutanedioate decarboxylase
LNPGTPERIVRAIQERPTPVCAYLYDRQVLLRQVRAVRAAIPATARLAYAMKANGHPELLAALAPEVDAIEVASGGELEAAIAAGARELYFAGPAKTDDELRKAVAAKAIINVESVHELRRLAWLDKPARVALRVNRAHTELPAQIKMTGVPTAFGIAEDRLGDALAELAKAPHLHFVGFHLHAVSNNLDATAHAAFVADAAAWSCAAAARFRVRPEHVNVGGGFGVDYTGDTVFDLSTLVDLPSSAPQSPLQGPSLVFEPGRFIAAPAGWYAAEVIDVKHTHGRWFAVVRGGTHHFRLPASWGYSHPFTVLPVDDWPYPFERPAVHNARIDVAGELCNPRDVLSRDEPVERVRAGDVLVFANTGAYGWEVAHRDFLAHPYPERVIL